MIQFYIKGFLYSLFVAVICLGISRYLSRNPLTLGGFSEFSGLYLESYIVVPYIEEGEVYWEKAYGYIDPPVAWSNPTVASISEYIEYLKKEKDTARKWGIFALYVYQIFIFARRAIWVFVFAFLLGIVLEIAGTIKWMKEEEAKRKMIPPLNYYYDTPFLKLTYIEPPKKRARLKKKFDQYKF